MLHKPHNNGKDALDAIPRAVVDSKFATCGQETLAKQRSFVQNNKLKGITYQQNSFRLELFAHNSLHKALYDLFETYPRSVH
jgi:hypothetical protein